MIVIMRDAIMPDCCNTCVCSEGYGCGITGTIMTTKEMESRPDMCPLEEVEPCEDAVSRHRLLNDLEELTTAWEKHPVMAKQIKGVETAIGYVKTIPSVKPEQRWIPCNERMPALDEAVLATTAWDDVTIAWREGIDEWRIHEGNTNAEIDDVIAWMPLPEPARLGND